MKKITVSAVFSEYDSGAALPAGDAALLQAARDAAPNAYAVYSAFNVGAAVELANGEIVTGTNQENVAYPSGLCAERVAVFSASSRFPGEKMLSIAVSCFSAKTPDQPFSPCGACRQVLSEYEQKQGAPIRIIMGGRTGSVLVSDSVAALLPLAFSAAQLKKE